MKKMTKMDEARRHFQAIIIKLSDRVVSELFKCNTLPSSLYKKKE